MMSSKSTGSNSSVYRKSPMCNTDKYVSAEAGNEMIMLNTTICDMQGSEASFGVGKPNKYTNVAMTVIAIGMIIQGLAKAPRLPFGIIYIDDNVKQQKTAMYMGIIYGVSIFGPAIAFAIGGYFSKQYVTLEDVPISPRHPAWIGAWWLGFIVVGALAIFVSLPLVCFPRRMRPRLPELKPLKTDSLKQSILDFFKSILRLICNSVYMPLVASICILQFVVAGMVSFGAKYLETQFFIPAWKANVLTGVMRISAASAGTVVGGLIVTKKKLSPLACVKMLLLQHHHENQYDLFRHVWMRLEHVLPGSDNRNYMSPCLAGRQQQDKMMFKDCACVGQNATAIPGLCETSCVMLYPYLVNIIVGAFLQTLGIMPALIVMLRSVSETDKSMAVGFSALLSTLCGWFAGPIAFGRMIDTACVIWSASCSGKGACSLYDNNDFRIKMSTLQVVAKVMVVSLQMVVFFRARIKTDWTVNKPDSSNTVEDLDVVKSMITEEESELTTCTFTDDWKPKRVSKGEKSNSR